METHDESKIEELDLYEILDLDESSSVAEIKKAYRKKALQCHPDKNPDNPNAAKEFQFLTKILGLLLDETARKVYDRVLKGRKEAALRTKVLDSKRRKLKEDLEEREKYAAKHSKQKTADQQLKDEIERLRKEGSRQVEDELANIEAELRAQIRRGKQEDLDSGSYKIKIKWDSNQAYSKDDLWKFLSKYGNLNEVVVSKKGKSALAEFTSRKSAELAIDFEQGVLKLEWLNPPPKSRRAASCSLAKPSDFESVVLTKLRQAEERQRLIAQMKAEDENS